MATLDDIANGLESLGATVNRSTFPQKMQDPAFAEKVRNALASGMQDPAFAEKVRNALAGASVSDSATFYNTYGNAQQPSGDVRSSNSGLQANDTLPTSGTDNGQTELEASVPTALDETFVQPTKDYLNRLDRDYAGPVVDLAKKNPGTVAAIGATALFPEASPLTAGLINAAAFGAGEAINKANPLTDEPNEWKTEPLSENALSVGGSALGAGLGSGLTSALMRDLGSFFGGPGTRKAAYNEAKDAAQAQYAKNRSALSDINQEFNPGISNAVKYNTAPVFSEPTASIDDWTLSNTDEALAYALSNAQRTKLDAIKSYMVRSNPEAYKGFGLTAMPSDKEAVDFYKGINKGIELPDSPKGMNFLSGLPNKVQKTAQIMGELHPRIAGPLVSSLTNNFAIPSVIKSSVDYGSKPLSLISGLGGFGVGDLIGSAPALIRKQNQAAR